MKIKLILSFLLFYLLSLLVTLPAEKAVRFIPANSDIKLAAVSGSIWSGQAAKLLYRKQFQLQQLEWQVDWLALARLQLKLDVKFNNGTRAMSGKGFILLGFSGLSLENFVVDVTAAELLSYTRLPVPVEAGGDLSLIIKDAAQGEPYCRQIDGYLVWKNAKISSEMGSVDLDSAQIDLSCKQGQLVADLQQRSEELEASINFLLKEKGAYQLRGVLKAGAELDPALKDALSWLGKKNSSGETLLNYNGRL